MLPGPSSGFQKKVVGRHPNLGIPFKVDNCKSIRELGLKYRPVSESFQAHDRPGKQRTLDTNFFFHRPLPLVSCMRLLPKDAVTAIKEAVNYRTRPTRGGLFRDAATFKHGLSDPSVGLLVARALTISNNLTFGDAELYLGRDLALLYA